MGNLRQESNFKTDDLPSGLGIAQWLGARRERLIQRGNHLDLTSQLEFIMEELKSTEYKAYNALKSSKTVRDSTIAFQSLYERCGRCMEDNRTKYALEYYNQYSSQ